MDLETVQSMEASSTMKTSSDAITKQDAFLWQMLDRTQMDLNSL
jgi:hypothetical protein